MVREFSGEPKVGLHSLNEPRLSSSAPLYYAYGALSRSREP
jgi:hypothetical protein